MVPITVVLDVGNKRILWTVLMLVFWVERRIIVMELYLYLFYHITEKNHFVFIILYICWLDFNLVNKMSIKYLLNFTIASYQGYFMVIRNKIEDNFYHIINKANKLVWKRIAIKGSWILWNPRKGLMRLNYQNNFLEIIIN